MIDALITITSLRDAVVFAEGADFKRVAQMPAIAPPEISVYRHHFGVWFRGQYRDKGLTPSVFRLPGADEESMIYHFMLRAATSADRCKNTLDWLCLMRHFELPTRLLDWSESLLVALFFAVQEGHDDEPGYLFILNGRRLNGITRKLPAGPAGELASLRASHLGIAVPLTVDTALRAEMSRARSLDDFRDQIELLNRNYIEDGLTFNLIRDQLRTHPDEILKFLSGPLAVFPNRLDTRMVLQQSVFTLHGGKQYRDTPERSPGVTLLPEPVGLEKLQEDNPNDTFLLRVKVENKADIRRQLGLMGIHEASLFPELDRLASYIKARWTSSVQDASGSTGPVHTDVGQPN